MAGQAESALLEGLPKDMHVNPTHNADLFPVIGTSPKTAPPKHTDENRRTEASENQNAENKDTFESSNSDRVPSGDSVKAPPSESRDKKQTKAKDSVADAPKGAEDLTPEEKKEVEKLKARDLEVRAHEQAHISAGGQYVSGGATYTYSTGPDGQRYAVGGEVPIDVSPVSGDPEATIQKAQAVQNAANAPANPSGQDRSVAAQARAMEAEASQELTKERAEEAKGSEESDDADDASRAVKGEENAGPTEPDPVSETGGTEQEGAGVTDVFGRKQTSQTDDSSNNFRTGEPDSRTDKQESRERAINAHAANFIRQVGGEAAGGGAGNLLDILS